MKRLVLAVFLATLIAAPTFAAQPLPQNAQFDSGFSPKHGALETVLKGIQAAKHDIVIAAYSFTSKPMATALVEAQTRGVKLPIRKRTLSNIPQPNILLTRACRYV